MGYYEGEIGSLGGSCNGNNGGGIFGGGDAWAAIILFALIFGWGRNGFGNGNGTSGMSVDLNGIATRNDLCSEFNFNNLENAVRGIQNGICDSTYALNNAITSGNAALQNTITNGNAALQNTITQGFYGTQNAILTNGYESRLATQSTQSQLESCCCKLEKSIADVACQAAANTGAIINAGQANTQRILDYLCNEKISSLQAENAALTSQLSQNAQTRTLIDTLLPVARPAYITCSPYQSAFGYPYGQAGYGCGCNVGCGCGTSIQ